MPRWEDKAASGRKVIRNTPYGPVYGARPGASSRLGRGCWPTPTGHAPREKNLPELDRPKTTIGHLGEVKLAYVYVGSRVDGAIKIGMSGSPERRCRNLRVTLVYAKPVTVQSAKEVETQTLRKLGARHWQSEFVWCAAEEAIQALDAAYVQVSKYMHVDPSLTPETAQANRCNAEHAPCSDARA